MQPTPPAPTLSKQLVPLRGGMDCVVSSNLVASQGTASVAAVLAARGWVESSTKLVSLQLISASTAQVALPSPWFGLALLLGAVQQWLHGRHQHTPCRGHVAPHNPCPATHILSCPSKTHYSSARLALPAVQCADTCHPTARRGTQVAAPAPGAGGAPALGTTAGIVGSFICLCSATGDHPALTCTRELT